MKDPLEQYEPPPLKEQIEPYERYGDAELAVTLLAFGKRFGGPGIPKPCVRGADFHCPDCGENVRAVTRGPDSVCQCPLCGERPGMVILGEGPK